MIQAIDVINFLSYITIGIMYILLIDLKYSLKNSLIAFSIFVLSSYGVYVLLLKLNILPSFVNTAYLAIPAAIFSYFLAKYKDSRFLFTLFTVDTFGLIIYLYARSLTFPLGEYSILIVLVAVILFSISLYFILKYRMIYINIQSQIKINWLSLACFAVLAYFILMVLISFPSPITTRIHELPAVILISFFISFAYIIIYRVFTKEIEVYNEKNEKAILELDNKYQKTQLELQKVYYKYAYEDEITGLKNRRALEEIKTEQHSQSTTCFTLDINNLKEINDENGHHAGDKALKILSDALKATFEQQEEIYRIGGDEFVVIINQYDEDMIKLKINLLHKCLIEFAKNENFDVSVAIGYSSYQNDEVDSFEALLKIADYRMYQDKAKYKLA